MGDHRPSRAAPRQCAACREISWRGVPSRRRSAGRRQRAHEGRPRQGAGDHRQRQADWRELQGSPGY